MTDQQTRHLVFAGGGTGGHLFPGIAVAEQLQRDWPRLRITFAGTGRPLERQHVEQAGFEYLAVRGHPLPRRPWQIVSFLIENLRGYRAARRFLEKEGVSAVAGLGGFASAAVAKAAVACDIPLALLEQNVVPGRATRWLAPSATFLCAAYEETKTFLSPNCPVFVTGNPLRAGFIRSPRPLAGEGPGVRAADRTATAGDEILRSAQDDYRVPLASRQCSGESRRDVAGLPAGIDPGLPRDESRERQLLILGGSGGAQTLNATLPPVLDRIRWALSGWRIVHQAGPAHADTTRQRYRELNLRASVVSFLPDMPAVLAKTDLAVCRAGGTTLSELAAMAVPAVLLPYPFAADDHQRKNAELYVASGGCLLLDEREHSDHLVDRLADTLSHLVLDEHQCRRMSQAVHRLGRPHAARDVAEYLGQLLAGG